VNVAAIRSVHLFFVSQNSAHRLSKEFLEKYATKPKCRSNIILSCSILSKSSSYMVASRCRGIGPPSSGIVLGAVFVGCRTSSASNVPCRVSIRQSTGILGIPLPALLSNTWCGSFREQSSAHRLSKQFLEKYATKPEVPKYSYTEL